MFCDSVEERTRFRKKKREYENDKKRTKEGKKKEKNAHRGQKWVGRDKRVS